MRKLLVLSAAAAALISAGSAYADTMAVATRDVNVRAGPASSSHVIGMTRQRPIRRNQWLRAERPLVHRRLRWRRGLGFLADICQATSTPAR